MHHQFNNALTLVQEKNYHPNSKNFNKVLDVLTIKDAKFDQQIM